MRTIERSKDRISYYLDGKLHREDGPAIEYHSGAQMWYRHGLRHREDGAAVIVGIRCVGARCVMGWYLHGRQYSEDEYNMKVFFEIC